MRRGSVVVVVVVALSSSTFAAAAFAAPAAPARPPAAPGPAGDVLPTSEQLQQQLNEGKHQEVLRQVAKLLAIRGERAKMYDRYELFVLRGEAALRGKAIPMAAEAFAQAAQATEDADKQAVARGTEILIRRSKPPGYVPKTAGATGGAAGAAPGAGANVNAAARAPRAQPNQPIPLIEQADRKRAMAALLVDEMAAAGPKIKAATQARGLPPVVDAIKTVADLRAIEIAATGTSDQTKAISGELGAHAHRLMSGALASMSAHVEECWSSASQVEYRVDRTGVMQEKLYGMLGLASAEQNALKETIATCEKIQPIASELAAVTGRAELIADAQEAAKLHARAIEVLNFDYPNEGRYNKRPKRAGAR